MMPGRMLGIEATFVQARRDGVTRLEAGEDVWGITLHVEDHPIRALSDAGVMTPAELDAVRLEALGGPLLAAARRLDEDGSMPTLLPG
jgi:hypothetical protein